MGDGWVHEIRAEECSTSDPKKSYPECISGCRSALIGSVGGHILGGMHDDAKIRKIARKLVTKLASRIAAGIASEIDDAENEVQAAAEHVECLAGDLESVEGHAIGQGDALILDYGDLGEGYDSDLDDTENAAEVTWEIVEDYEAAQQREAAEHLAADLLTARHELAERQKRVDELVVLRDMVGHSSDLDGDGWTDLALEIGNVGGFRSDDIDELADLVAKLAKTILKGDPVTLGGSDGLGQFDRHDRSNEEVPF